MAEAANQSVNITRWAWQTAHCNIKPRTDICIGISSGSLQTEHVCSANIYLISFVLVHCTYTCNRTTAQRYQLCVVVVIPKVYSRVLVSKMPYSRHFIYLRSISHRNKFDFTMDTHWCDESFRSTNKHEVQQVSFDHKYDYIMSNKIRFKQMTLLSGNKCEKYVIP